MNIALTFSGGGYRAASFSLGVLSYLSQLKIGNGVFLDNVTVLSTVSGGTITGTKYAIGLKKGLSFAEIYESLYKFMSDVDLVSESLNRLASKKGWDGKRARGLITAIADVYNEHLFENEKFGLLLDDHPPITLKHGSFNATEFANALQFRFQFSEEISNGHESGRGVIGNYYYNIPFETASSIRFADILAASSCFPGGFEPINFPDDFVLPDQIIQDFKNNPKYPVGLMDGGIVDNQGITPVMLAENRLKRILIDASGEVPKTNVIDLIIVSDVASPYMEEYKARPQKSNSLLRKITPIKFTLINLTILLASGCWSYLNLSRGFYGWLLVSIPLVTLSVLLFLSVRFFKSLPRRLHIPTPFRKRLRKLLKISFGIYESMLQNRLDSMLKMTQDVFLKHIRRLNFQVIFNDPSWKNRRIMNAIYELRKGENRIQDKVKSGVLPTELIPSLAIQDVATKAASMGTTLWFSQAELAKEKSYNMLDSIIACGQFTICWNLLEYIEKIKKDDSNLSDEIRYLLNSENQLLSDWAKFQENPYWMIK